MVKEPQVLVSIVIPYDWEIVSFDGLKWAAKKLCKHDFCANIVYFEVIEQDDFPNLIQKIEKEVENNYQPNYKLIFRSPIYQNPTQFSMGYTFITDSMLLVGYTFLIENNGKIHTFEMLDIVLDEMEIEEKLKYAAELFSSVVIENK